MDLSEATTAQKAIAYITRDAHELLVFKGPDYDGLQVPRGTVEEAETPREALFREVVEESGLATLRSTRHLTTDVWERSRSPPRLYVRHYFHTMAHDPPDAWCHVVDGAGPDRGDTYEFSWISLSSDQAFALDLDDYLSLLPSRGME